MATLVKYYGSKFNMTETIIQHFPSNFKIYIEGFGGGGSVLLAKKPSPVEIYNDVGENIYSLFKVLSDKELFHQLKEKLDLTYYSAQIREEFKESLKCDNLSVVDRAYKYFYVSRTSFNGTGGFSTNMAIRRNISKCVSDYLSAIDNLKNFHIRLSDVIIEHRDIMDLLEKYSADNVFFYLDPPYVHSTRTSSTNYEKEMTDEEHIKMIDKILSSKGKFLISGYENDLYKKLEDNGFHKELFKSPNVFSDKTECLWWNYDIEVKKGFEFGK